MLTHPAIVLTLMWAAWFAVDLGLSRSRRRPLILWTLGLAAAATAVTVFAAIVIWYVFQPGYFDRAESTITAVSTVFAAGRPLYPALDAPERYAHI
jgi:hypothetical protein